MTDITKVVAFDLEITKIIPATNDLLAHRPFGISVAATLASDGEKEDSRLWYGEGHPSGDPWPQMPQVQVQVLVRYLERMVNAGFTIVTWNGLGFDFLVLADESGLHEECVALALDHVDPMWHFFCANGYAVGLNAVAKGMGTREKMSEVLGGAMAPLLWAEGKYRVVKKYCARDAQVTMDIFQAIQKHRKVTWQSSKGYVNTWNLPAGRLLTVAEAMKLPLPEPPSWISDPWPRERFTAWLGK